MAASACLVDRLQQAAGMNEHAFAGIMTFNGAR
jgi:hypothetical protein